MSELKRLKCTAQNGVKLLLLIASLALLQACTKSQTQGSGLSVSQDMLITPSKFKCSSCQPTIEEKQDTLEWNISQANENTDKLIRWQEWYKNIKASQ